MVMSQHMRNQIKKYQKKRVMMMLNSQVCIATTDIKCSSGVCLQLGGSRRKGRRNIKNDLPPMLARINDTIHVSCINVQYMCTCNVYTVVIVCDTLCYLDCMIAVKLFTNHLDNFSQSHKSNKVLCVIDSIFY